ncbi:hypothetical protein KPSA1_01843 [Pseudomonas syringae pv. actinidiae]|uniref:Uncharacterized protein n=1 Tax=Pseudomonas syringae pv. actinidiae TaxID=103796 RepID=A0A2V0Q6Q8_PSESF|nr:hypothetical protein KPSA1_01843 [Pseudomonas syringae pv. actinidiae]
MGAPVGIGQWPLHDEVLMAERNVDNDGHLQIGLWWGW